MSAGPIRRNTQSSSFTGSSGSLRNPNRSWCAPSWGFGYGSGGTFFYLGSGWGNCWWGPWWWAWNSCWNSYWNNCWYYAPRSYYTTVYYGSLSGSSGQTVVIYEELEEEEPTGEAAVLPAPQALPAQAPDIPGQQPGTVLDVDTELAEILAASGASVLNTAAERYLVLGDRAFREGRFGNSVHFYARAVEFAPGEGALYLVLSDALFATGDYHYGAYAIRKALELEPSLADAIVDKHSFYGDPQVFERHLAVLETYLEDYPADGDARLVLAVNCLFGLRPAQAVDLLETPSAAALRSDPAARIILASARSAQFGPPTQDS